MESRAKNFYGGLFFLPLITDIIWRLLEYLGMVQTAYSLFQTQWVTINWPAVSGLTALAGVWWLIFVNWRWIVSLFVTTNAQRFYACQSRAENVLPLLESRHGAKAAIVLEDGLRKGKLDAVGLCEVRRQRMLIPPSFWALGGCLTITRKHGVAEIVLKDHKSASDAYSHIHLNKDQLAHL